MNWRMAIPAILALVWAPQAAVGAERGDPLAAMSEQQLDALAARLAAGIPRKPRVLILGAERGFHHESISDAMVAIAVLGQESGLFDAELRTDFDLINPRGGKKMRFGFIPEGLGDFDAVVLVNTTGEWGLGAEAKQALLGFVHDRGKGIVGVHGALDANYSWPEYTDMLGAGFGGHPLNTIDKPVVTFPLVNEGPDSPITRHWPRSFSAQNELYVPKAFSRAKTRSSSASTRTGSRLLRPALRTSPSPGRETTAPVEFSIPASAIPAAAGPIPKCAGCIWKPFAGRSG